jgi:hypothetical protein
MEYEKPVQGRCANEFQKWKIWNYYLILERVQVRCDWGGTEPAGEYTFCYEKGNENREFGTVFFI